MTSLALISIALLGLPASFIAFCIRVHRRGASWFTYLAYFVLFGTLGGWILAFGLSPSGLTAVSVIYLTTIASFACLIVGLVYTFKQKRNRLEIGALVAGYLYPTLIVLFVGYSLMNGK